MFEQAFKNIDDVLRKEAGCTTELDYTEQASWMLFLKYLDGLEQDNHAHILKFDDMATQRFVEFYLGSIKLNEYITGAAQPKLNQKALNSIPIPIPKSIDAQAKIVDSLESLSDETQRLESLYQRKLAALDELKKSLLHRAFSGQL